VGHNPAFDIGFLNAAIQRTQIKRSPFIRSAPSTRRHWGLGLSADVLAKIAQAAGLEWDNEKAHSALYDCRKTPSCFV